MAQNNEKDNAAIIQLFRNAQESIRYHGERMWDSMKFFSVILPGFTGILAFIIPNLDKLNISIKFEYIIWLFFCSLAFTIIFWFNTWRENNRFLEYVQISKSAENVLGFFDKYPKNDNKPLLISRFNEPYSIPQFNIWKNPRKWSFWTINCLFFGTSLITQIGLLISLYVQNIFESVTYLVSEFVPNVIGLLFQFFGITIILISQLVFIARAKQEFGSVKKAFIDASFPRYVPKKDVLKSADKEETKKLLETRPLAKFMWDDFKLSLFGLLMSSLGILIDLYVVLG